MVNRLMIQRRDYREINTDPQRRCYYGVHAKSEWVWTSWQDHETIKPEDEERRLQFWRELNDYAVSQRGKGAKSEYRTVKRETDDLPAC